MTTALADLSWTQAELASTPGTLLAIPVGSTEQHGPHLPLSTDTDIAFALAELLAARHADVVIAPAIAYGSSGEHAGFAGTLSIGQEAIELLLLELVRSASGSFPRVLLISAHGGNRQAVLRAERRLRVEGHDARAFFPRWEGDAHAGRVETSLMLALHPARVQSELAAPGALAPLEQLLPRLVREGVGTVSANGVLGDPTGASAREGRFLLELAAEQMSELLRRWEDPQ
jgi:mycofactocin system creatininase family protein